MLGTLIYIILVIIAIIVIIILLRYLFAVIMIGPNVYALNLDADNMKSYPDQGTIVTLTNSTNMTVIPITPAGK